MTTQEQAQRIALNYCALMRATFTTADLVRIVTGELDPLLENPMPGELLEEALANVLGADLVAEEDDDAMDALRDQALELAEESEYMLGDPEVNDSLASWIDFMGNDVEQWKLGLRERSQPGHDLLALEGTSAVGLNALEVIRTANDMIKLLPDISRVPKLELLGCACHQIQVLYFG